MKARTTSTRSSSAARRQGSRRSARALAALPALLCLLAGAPSAAQPADAPNGVLLVAKPSVQDPNFRRTVVLVTQTPDGNTVGVILNRPTRLKLAELLPQNLPTEHYKGTVFFGGPVMQTAVVALFRAEAPPAATAFPVLPGIYLSMHPANLTELLARPGQHYRLYAGFSGWAPRQLESELQRDGWHVLPVREELLFREDTSGMWGELLLRASGQRAQVEKGNIPANGARCIDALSGLRVVRQDMRRACAMAIY